MMAVGRLGVHDRKEYRDRDSDRESLKGRSDHRCRDECERERARSRGLERERLGDSRVRVSEGHVKERDGVNGFRRRRSHGRSSSELDREPGELSSGSDGPESRDRRVDVDDRGGKKLKFSPIVWDGDNKGSDARKPASAALPPPPPLPQGFLPRSEPAEAGIRSTGSATSVLDYPVSQNGPSRSDDMEPGELDEEDHVPTRNIAASRWADDSDGRDSDEEIVLKRGKSRTPTKGLEGCQAVSSSGSEPGEVVREGSVGSGSKSSGHGGREMEVAEDDSDYEDAARLSSSVDSEAEEEPAGMPEPLKPPRRGINMLQGCRSVFEFEKLNKIDEGTYGVVFRAKDKKSGEIVALKKVKMERQREGFPLTALREMNILLSLNHPSIVDVKEVVMGKDLNDIFMVMEYMEHDLKGLMETLRQPFSQSEVKCLMLQLLEGVKCLHDNWVLHRDLKTSNLLFNNQGELKICDFGMARQYGSPLKPFTSLVVTLWYRAPELLLVPKEHLTAEYSTAVDMWSLGCIMAEMLAKEPLFSGKTEIDQLDKIFKMLGTPTEKIWPGLAKLPRPRIYTKQPYNKLREKFPPTSFCGGPTLSEAGFDLLNRLLTYDPEKRITAEAALQHEWFREVPLPKSKDFMPTFPAQHAQDRRLRRVLKSPDPLKEQQRKEMQQRELGSAGLFGFFVSLVTSGIESAFLSSLYYKTIGLKRRAVLLIIIRKRLGNGCTFKYCIKQQKQHMEESYKIRSG